MKIPNMWKAWLHDSPAKLDACFEHETSLAECAYERLVEKVIKSGEDADSIFVFLQTNMHKLVLYQKHLICAQSGSYPQISFDQAWSAIEFVQSQEKFAGLPLPRAQVELCFQSATGADGNSALKGSMNRAALLNFLVRLAQCWVRRERGTREKISVHFTAFMKLYVDPVLN